MCTEPHGRLREVHFRGYRAAGLQSSLPPKPFHISCIPAAGKLCLASHAYKLYWYTYVSATRSTSFAPGFTSARLIARPRCPASRCSTCLAGAPEIDWCSGAPIRSVSTSIVARGRRNVIIVSTGRAAWRSRVRYPSRWLTCRAVATE